ncbi:LPXTG cell wall anchor domain-containing protein [Aerococcus sanguinicola]|uniref:Gram-positive cocci surface proteins LPxTG domain-containing protein n=1 Tax=Aerococcus sanguinicola TaxID=119206 RepID=A0A0X8FA66_9LACT|nr:MULTISPECIES: LPXTG cell wall anchor domain-containing protein [Aerococcus]AMB93602.1 hypothetical protein AWM72_01970 [Aerococcus sanguinicola]MDK7050822.1 LPXTG cell wall anchor domain-containing protein [Aerococcus sanguinicola]OFT97723.1 hypothetical protein HMPREF3090_00370 [Aerococcus sp. HMSC23C02]PKZ21670.1 hypothetical protein CYJ28_07130 [Aerococcus sanguinicola]
MKNLKKVLLTSVATTAAAGAFFAANADVAQAAPAFTPETNADGVPVLPEETPEQAAARKAAQKQVEENLQKSAQEAETKPSNNAPVPDVMFETPGSEENTTTTPETKPETGKVDTAQNEKGYATAQEAEEAAKNDPTYVEGAEIKISESMTNGEKTYHYVISPNVDTKNELPESPYEYEAETKEAAIEIGEAMLKRSKLEGTALAQVNNHVDAVQTASGKWTPSFSFVEKEETPAEEDNKKPADKKDEKAEDKKDPKAEDKKDNKSEAGKEDPKAEDKKDNKKAGKSDKQVAADKKVAAKKSEAVKANGNKDVAKKEAAKKAKSTLPKTGAVASAAPAVLGLALASVGTAFAFGKKKEDK